MVPILAIVVLYLLIWKALKHNSKLFREGFDERYPINRMQVSEKKSDQNKTYKRIVRRETKVMIRIILYFALFCLAWTPYSILVMLGQYSTDISNYVTPFSSSLPIIFAKSSCVYNPIVGFIGNRGLKKRKKLYGKNKK